MIDRYSIIIMKLSSTRRELHVDMNQIGMILVQTCSELLSSMLNRRLRADATTESHAQSDNFNRISAWASEMADSSTDPLTGMPQTSIDIKFHHIMRTKGLHMWSNLI